MEEHSGSLDFDRCVDGCSDKKDPMRIWLAMKQNGFVTPSFGVLPMKEKIEDTRNEKARAANVKPSSSGVLPSNKICRKVKLENVKKVKRSIKFASRDDRFIGEVEIGKVSCSVAEQESKPNGRKRKKEDMSVHQNDRLTKISAPSGLLNDLKPGIMSRVRTSEQVCSVILALLRIDKMEYVTCERECMNTSSGSQVQRQNAKEVMADPNVQSQDRGQFADFQKSIRKIENEDDKDEAKSSLSASTNSENASSSISSNDAPSISSGDSSFMASQWLQILRQDTMRRLAALTNSKMRVQNVIQTEIPFLTQKEFALNQENELSAAAERPGPGIAAMHKAQWNNLFCRMDKALTEEENQLELWLNQIIEMQSHMNEASDTSHAARQFLQSGMLESHAR